MSSLNENMGIEHQRASTSNESNQISWCPASEKKFICCWRGCSDEFEARESLLTHFSGSHIAHCFENCDPSSSYVCGVNCCKFSTNEPDFLHRHMLFHGYHVSLMDIGRWELQNNHETKEKLQLCCAEKQTATALVYDGSPLQCCWNACEETFDEMPLFIKHVNHHVSSNRKGDDFLPREMRKNAFKCEWEGCTAKVKRGSNLIQHVQHHTGEKKCACPNCGAFFSTKLKLIDHLLRKRTKEEADKAFQCLLCNKCFASQRLLRDHCRHHVSNYKCSYCEMTFETPSHVRTHIAGAHNNERHSVCNHCNKTFKRVPDLQQHVKHMHCGFEYKCATCGMQFRWKASYDLHKRKHQDIRKPYKCHLCDWSSTRGNYLTQHLITEHDVQRPCGFSKFTYRKDPNTGYYHLMDTRVENVHLKTLEKATESVTVVDWT